MTQRPPQASQSSRPPAAPSAVDGARLVTALAAGGSVLLLSITAVAIWPRTYGTEATLVLDGGAHVENPTALAGRIEAALLEREQLASAAMDLPPELRSPDPIGRLRAGIRVQSRGALGFSVEFRGSDPQSVQRIANRLADRAVALLPKLASSPDDAASLKELAARSRAVSEFIGAHPEVTLEPGPEKGNAAQNPKGGDSALDLLRTEKRQIEQKLGTGAADNPYADASDDPALLNRRLVELKSIIQRREAALKQPRPDAHPASPELTGQWRALLADLAAAQAKASAPAARPLISAHVTARASLPSSPLTPNRLMLSIVGILLSLAAAMLAYVLPRKTTTLGRQRPHSNPPGRSDPPAAAVKASGKSDPPPNARSNTLRMDPEPPPKRSDPPGPRPNSEPPGPMAPQRTVVLSSTVPLAAAATEKRSNTAPGGLEAPSEAAAEALAATVVARPQTPSAHGPPAAPLFGSRPPPGAGSYSVSSSHPPPFEPDSGKRTTVERLSPLQSAHPPATAAVGGAPRHPSPARGGEHTPQIMSKPPALDPDAERWAARFETPPPPEPEEAAPRKRSGRWKTQVMGSMVPLDVLAAREERAPLSEPPLEVQAVVEPKPVTALAVATEATLTFHDVPSGWRPNVDPEDPQVITLRDAILKQGLSRRIKIAVTGSPGNGKAQVASGLALSLAQAGARVLLVEADFDNPQIHQTLAINAPPGAGFSQQMVARRHAPQPRPWVVMRCSPNLQVLAEGRLRSPGLLASPEFAQALRELGEQHHVVVIHAPAVDRPGDLRAIDGFAQAAIIARSQEPATIQFGDSPLRSLL